MGNIAVATGVAGVWAVTLALITLTLLPIVKHPAWWIRIWDYPRMQISAGLAVALVTQFALLPMNIYGAVLSVLTIGCLGWQLHRIRPYTFLHRVQVLGDAKPEPTEEIVLLVANVLQENRRSSDLCRIIRDADPDIVLTLETNSWWDQQLEPLLAEYPHAVRHPLENTYGMHLFSRFELQDAVLHERICKDIPSISVRVQMRSRRWINLHCLHPEPPQVDNDTAERDAELLLVAKEMAKDRQPTIVFGDLNDVAWSRTTRLFQRISGMLDPRVGRGLYSTFHAEHWFARWPLDHVFHDPCFRLTRLKLLPYFGSDHFAVVVGLAYDAAALQKHEVPEADAEDRQEAAEMIAEGREAAADAGNKADPGLRHR